MIRSTPLYKKNLIMTVRYLAFFMKNLCNNWQRLTASAEIEDAMACQNIDNGDKMAGSVFDRITPLAAHFHLKTAIAGGVTALLCLSASASVAQESTNRAISGSASVTLSTQHLTPQHLASAVVQRAPLSDEAIRNAVAMPRMRPPFTEAWGGTPVKIALPARRPSLADMLPQSTRSISEMVAVQTGRQVTDVIELTLNRGDTLASTLKKANFTNQSVAAVSSALSGHINLRKLQIGTGFTIGLDADNQPVGLQLHSKKPQRLNEKAITDGFIEHYVLLEPKLEDDSGAENTARWITIKAIRPVETAYVHAGSQIDASLYKAAMKSSIPLAALDEFVTVMGFSVDFQREIREGDSFELVYEKAVDGLTGKVLSTGNLHYAGVVLSGRKMGFYRFVHRNGRVGWYDRKGESAIRTLMRTPVNGARISSGYGMRRHPTKGYNAMHKGIDFAVPTGTPILAAGSGHVELAGWNGSYGHYIRIRHSSTYKTAYAHLSGYAKGIRRGSVVEQGQVIGYVGSTGRSTGPHLHYEILVNNRKVNPLTVKLPTGKSVSPAERGAFMEQVARIERQLQHTTTPQYAGITFSQPVF